MGHTSQLAVPIADTDHVLGWPDAPVTVIEYGDFECPVCRQAFSAVKLLRQRCGRDILFAYRHYPLDEPHPHALPAAEAAECAASQGRFWEMHDLLFENQARLHRKHLQRYARHLQLDVQRFEQDLDAHTYASKVRSDIDSGIRSHILGAPAFFVNGQIIDVSFGMLALFNAAEAALQGRSSKRYNCHSQT